MKNRHPGTIIAKSAQSRRQRFAERRCVTCGKGTIAIRDAKGQTLPHRDAPAVTLARSCLVPMCDHCGEMLLDIAAVERLDDALETAYRAQRLGTLQGDLNEILVTFRMQQQELEQLLGVSAGYVSKVIAGKKEASPLLVRLAHMIRATGPATTWQSLHDIALLPRRRESVKG